MPTNYRFTGQLAQPEAGLYYYGARWYDPALGRFTQADTLIPQPGNPLDWDRYAYVRNSPVNYTDPIGNFTCEDSFEGCSRKYTSYTHQVTISISSNFPLTKEEANRYMELANTPGWWNNYTSGSFSVLDYYQLLMSMEFSTLPAYYNEYLTELFIQYNC